MPWRKDANFVRKNVKPERQWSRGVFTGEARLEYLLDSGHQAESAPLLLALHGYGMDHDFFAALLQSLRNLPLQLLVPKAPIPAAGIRQRGASWYDYDGNQQRFVRELQRTENLLLSFLDHVEAERELRPKKRLLLGFSQGGYCGAYVALRHPEIFDGMVISGARVKTEILESEMQHAGARGFSVLLCHGQRDVSVKLEAAESSQQVLEQHGVATQLRIFDTGHSMGRQQVRVIAEWLARFLPETSDPGNSQLR